MSSSRLEHIRLKEKQYHEECYENVKLFAEGSWLQKPVKSVMDAFELLPKRDDLRALDLGCGVGRNSIPLAVRLQGTHGKVVCVDLLESALTHLERYGREHGVSGRLELIRSDIGEFHVAPEQYDYVVSVSTLEHVASVATFEHVIESLIRGTKELGVHCFLINANIRETEVETGLPLDPMFELLLETAPLLSYLRTAYADWSIVREHVKPYSLEITRDDKPVLLESDVVTWVAQNRPG
jgi:cyclopropane fatty-acyl-phospholipid synthase-like methyltransferase